MKKAAFCKTAFSFSVAFEKHNAYVSALLFIVGFCFSGIKCKCCADCIDWYQFRFP
jgi:hypothetical protein